MPTNSSQDLFLRHVGKHVLIMLFRLTDRRGGAVPDFASCFVMELDGVWMLLTAGHVVAHIRKKTADGAGVSNVRLVDVLAGQSLPPLPISFEPADWIVIDDQNEDGADYAALPLNFLTQSALRRAGVMPIPPSHMGAPVLADYSQAFLVGVPGETFQDEGADGSAKLMMMPLKPHLASESHPAKGDSVLAALAEEHTPAEHNVQNIQGTSGGPIFGLKLKPGESIGTYWLIGLQSAWYEQSRVIRFCPVARFVHALRTAAELHRQHFGVEPGSALSISHQHLR